MKMAKRLLVAAFVVAALVGCKSENPGVAAGKAAVASDFHQSVLDRVKETGLKIGEFESSAAKPYDAARCVRGQVATLDVLMCAYDSDQSATKAKKKLASFIGGAVTGVVRQSKSTLIGVADRKKSDLKGKKINQLLKAFGS